MIEQLENDLGILSEWFKNNYMKLNIDKCKLLTNNEKDSVSIEMDSDSSFKYYPSKIARYNS